MLSICQFIKSLHICSILEYPKSMVSFIGLIMFSSYEYMPDGNNCDESAKLKFFWIFLYINFNLINNKNKIFQLYSIVFKPEKLLHVYVKTIVKKKEMFLK